MRLWGNASSPLFLLLSQNVHKFPAYSELNSFNKLLQTWRIICWRYGMLKNDKFSFDSVNKSTKTSVISLPNCHIITGMGGGVKLHSFLTSSRTQCWRSESVSRRTCPNWRSPYTHCIGGWLYPKAVVNVMAKWKISKALTMNRIAVIQYYNFTIEKIEDSDSVIAQLYVLWHVDLLLGNDREISSYTIAVAK
jgi:hypothetical protein